MSLRNTARKFICHIYNTYIQNLTLTKRGISLFKSDIQVYVYNVLNIKLS